MSSRFRIEAALCAALALAACDNAQKSQQVVPQSEPPDAVVSGLVPAGGSLPTQPDPRALPYLDNAEAVSTGKKLYAQYNCVGCHFNGGGGIGPALMDDQWIYGGRLDQIYSSIYHGRPNGMPAWGDKIVDQQIWQIAAYVRSMSLPKTLAAQGEGETPSQHPAPVPHDADAFGGWDVPGQDTTKDVTSGE